MYVIALAISIAISLIALVISTIFIYYSTETMKNSSLYDTSTSLRTADEIFTVCFFISVATFCIIITTFVLIFFIGGAEKEEIYDELVEYTSNGEIHPGHIIHYKPTMIRLQRAIKLSDPLYIALGTSSLALLSMGIMTSIEFYEIDKFTPLVDPSLIASVKYCLWSSILYYISSITLIITIILFYAAIKLRKQELSILDSYTLPKDSSELSSS